TSKSTRSSVVVMLVTVGGAATGTRGALPTVTSAPWVFVLVDTSVTLTRGQSFGPDPASSTSRSFTSLYQSTDASRQWTPLCGPVMTAGRFWSGVTSSEPRTSNTCQSPVDAISVRSGLMRACANASGEKAM